MKAIIIIIIKSNLKGFFFFNLVWIKLKLKNINYFYFFNETDVAFFNSENADMAFKKF